MNVLKIIGVVVLLSTVAFIGVLYLTLRTKTQIVSDQEPFSSFLNQNLSLERDVLLVHNLEEFSFEQIHKIEEKGANVYEGVTVFKELEKGTSITFEDAKLFTNGTSGFTTCVLFGTVYLESQEIKFEYHWGDQQISLDKNDKGYWTFSKPIWKSQQFDKKYFIE